MNKKIITILIMGVMMLTATTVFSAEDYNSSRSNTSTSIVDQQIGDILLRYGVGSAEINKVTGILAQGVSKADLKATLIGVGIGEEGVSEIFIKLDKLGVGVDTSSSIIAPKPISPTTTVSPRLTPTNIEPSTSVPGLAPSIKPLVK